MQFVNTADGGLIWPSESITGGVNEDGSLLDTGWRIDWPGPGEVYLNDRDLVDIVVAAVSRPAVQRALATNRWQSPESHEAAVAGFKQAVEEAQARVTDAETKVEHLTATLLHLTEAKKAAAPKAPAKAKAPAKGKSS